ncbi:uncharacterized protein LOC133926491 [Phragmites australis]|uniref:uncharacterized protein LOC133926491 n=1 Tax=Phragmites australis TaxID=29695 RepID=UPI002D773DBA|nr:uncharacterized protein LOC133926491 [Phragmites australis]
MEVEAARCECCGFTEECTPAYIAAVRAEHLGRWVCGLCAEAVGDEIRRAGAGGAITTAEALDRHVAFARAPARRSAAAAAEDDLVAAIARLLRRCLDSPPASPAAPVPAPQVRKVAAGPGFPDGADA